MNEHEREDAHRIGTVIRAARKLRGMSQSTISKKLQVTQATLSNIEKGQVAISGSLWYRLSETLDLPADHAFQDGIVDNINRQEDPLETGFKIPKRYSNNAFSTIRASQPFLKYFECCCGKKALEEFMKDRLNIDADVRFIYNLRLSIRFNFDLAAQLIRLGHLKISSLSKVTSNLTSPQIHGILSRHYKNVQDRFGLIKILLAHIAHYERNFNYSIVDESKGQLDLLSVPSEFMRYFSYREDELPDFINLYRQSFIQSFSGYLGHARPLCVTVIPSSTKRKTECVFRITV